MRRPGRLRLSTRGTNLALLAAVGGGRARRCRGGGHPARSLEGRSLARGHGFPLRLVAPGRRGFWWVKWVDRIELQSTPSWWQPPFPLT